MLPTKGYPLRVPACDPSKPLGPHSGSQSAASEPPAARHAAAGRAPGGARLFSRQSLLRWSSQGFWAILDQALFASSNLLVNVLLARWLPPAEYGAFVTAYTVLLLVSVAHSAFIGEPMLVFGADKYAASFSDYLRVLQRYHWRLTVSISFCFMVSAMVLILAGDTLLGHAAVGLSIAIPSVLMSWLGRRACYVVGRPRLAAFGGGVSLTVMMIGITLLSRLQLLSVLSGQLLQSAAALSAAALMMLSLRRVTTVPLGDGQRSSVWRDHWQYGRWIGATGLVMWFKDYTYYVVLPIFGGLAATGALKALTNLVMPILQSDSALVTLLMPTLVRSRREAGQFARVTTWSAAGFATEALVYWGVLVLLGTTVVEWIYGGVYQFSPTAVVVVGLVPLVAGQSNILSTALRARERPDGVFWATVVAAVWVSTVGVFAAIHYGITGAIVGSVSATVMHIAVMLWVLRK
jgi:O-antigen/teichoic acid export membrane protein